MLYLGIDTSNYTTSLSLYNQQDNSIKMEKKLLEVKENEIGIRQSDAVFLHTKQFFNLYLSLLKSINSLDIKAVGVSTKPRNVINSYMPCFLVGENIAKIIGTTLNIPVYEFSHQQGHILAALYSADALHLLNKEFLAYHISGGTTECVLVKYENNILSTEILSKTLDVNMGQLIDRVGKMLSLPFPSGRYLENEALKFDTALGIENFSPSIKGMDCCLSGIQNKCNSLFLKGFTKEYISYFLLNSLSKTILSIHKNITEEYGNMPVIFSGGVMSNSIVQEKLSIIENSYFSKPEYSTDNSAGLSLLAYYKYKGNQI